MAADRVRLLDLVRRAHGDGGGAVLGVADATHRAVVSSGTADCIRRLVMNPETAFPLVGLGSLLPAVARRDRRAETPGAGEELATRRLLSDLELTTTAFAWEPSWLPVARSTLLQEPRYVMRSTAEDLLTVAQFCLHSIDSLGEVAEGGDPVWWVGDDDADGFPQTIAIDAQKRVAVVVLSNSPQGDLSPRQVASAALD